MSHGKRRYTDLNQELTYHGYDSRTDSELDPVFSLDRDSIAFQKSRTEKSLGGDERPYKIERFSLNESPGLGRERGGSG